MSWTFAPTFDAGHRAALAGGKNLIYVCPPAGWAVVPLLQRLAETPDPGLTTLLLAPEPSDAAELASLAATGWPVPADSSSRERFAPWWPRRPTRSNS